MTDKVLLQCKDVHKSFSTVQVLKGISLEVEAGEILSIIGGNGAGKSTLMKILMGVYSKDKGQLIINGKEYDNLTPAQALENGIYLVPQEPLLFMNMTVEENILLGLRGNRVDNLSSLKQLMKELNWNIDLDRQAMTLSIAEQQLVEILKGLIRKSRVLILDEPTSSLTYNEIRSLFELMNKLKSEGVGIIYITHRLNEVMEMSTKIVVLRDGKITLKGPISDFDEEKLISGLLPEDTEIKQYKADRSQLFNDKEEILKISDFSGNGFKNINLTIRSGEIVGLAGVVGAGRTELAETIFGRDEVHSGNVMISNINIIGKSTVDVIKFGLNYVPEDRFKNGIFKISSIKDNISSASLPTMKGLMIDNQVESKLFEDFRSKFKIVCREEDQEIGDLSGGNQQKIVLAKTVSSMPRVLILDEPTRGIDAGAREDVYQIIEHLKSIGVAILLISSDMEELVQLSDRVVSMYRGRVNAEFIGEEISSDNLTSAIFGVVKEAIPL